MASWVSARNIMAGATFYNTPGAYTVAGFPAANVLQPERPYKTARTDNTTGDKDIYFDFGVTPVTYDTIVVVNANYANWTCGASSNSGFSPGLPGGVPTLTPMTARCPWNTRFMVFGKFAAPVTTGRYFIFRIPGGQATHDGAAYYSTGGLWLGTFENLRTILGRSWKWAYTFGPSYPELKIGPSHMGWSRTVRRSNPRASLSANLEPTVDYAAPGGADGLNKWLDLQYRIRQNYFGAVIEDGHPSHAMIFEDMTPPPMVDYPVATLALRFEEAV